MEVLNELMKKGLSKFIEGKSGGANILNISTEQLNIGRNNILFIKEYLSVENFCSFL